ncbi:GvpL/GvpF family gas vesicle protein [Roseivivax isoporae]|uniref:Uncharacterized protein n=1 Tax=Roseivivax isoporae LMG 25204 TaxID=1449351 RepID=X7F9F5_9RHOB|nr:hypothetical protein [Roseivivax isoporae]ETX29358.1 hypothetical protein RISW2_01425 [Roseivivax isoporae LMG 25204]
MTTRELIAVRHAGLPYPREDGIEIRREGALEAVLAPPARRLLAGRRAALGAAARHMRRLEALMVHGTVLPALPGTRLPEALVGATLCGNAAVLLPPLERVAGRVQFQVTVAAPDGLAPDDVPPPLRAAIATRLAGPGFDRIALPVASGVIANHVLLINPAEIDTLDAVLEDIDRLGGGALRIRRIGPAPAVSFASVGLARLPARAVNAALRRFGLPPDARAEDLGSARRAALRADPGAQAAISTAAEIAATALAASWRDGPLFCATLWTEARAESSDTARRVA